MKEKYLANVYSQRVDGLVYILHEFVILDYMNHHCDIRSNIRRRVLNRAERNRQRLALDLSGNQSSNIYFRYSNNNIFLILLWLRICGSKIIK